MNTTFIRRMRLSMLADDPRCVFCLRMLNEATATVDHLIPVARGGETTPENCRLACVPCNQRKANCSLEELLILPPIGVMTQAQAEYLIIDHWTGRTLGFSYAGREWMLDEAHSVRLMLANLPVATWRLGRRLMHVRERLNDEEGFNLWLSSEFTWSAKDARVFIRIAEQIPEPAIKRKFGFTAMRMLARDGVPRPAVETVVRLANTGCRITMKRVAMIIKGHRKALRSSLDTRSEIPRVCGRLTCEAVTGS